MPLLVPPTFSRLLLLILPLVLVCLLEKAGLCIHARACMRDEEDGGVCVLCVSYG